MSKCELFHRRTPGNIVGANTCNKCNDTYDFIGPDHCEVCFRDDDFGVGFTSCFTCEKYYCYECGNGDYCRICLKQVAGDRIESFNEMKRLADYVKKHLDFPNSCEDIKSDIKQLIAVIEQHTLCDCVYWNNSGC